MQRSDQKRPEGAKPRRRKRKPAKRLLWRLPLLLMLMLALGALCALGVNVLGRKLSGDQLALADLDSAALARYLEAERSYGYPWQVYAACDRAGDSRGASRQGVEELTAALAGSGDTPGEMLAALYRSDGARAKKAQRELARLDTAASLLAGKTFPLDVSNQRRDYTIRHNYTDSAEPFGGKVHRGVDIACPVGTEVYAVGDGVVEKLAWDQDLGYVLILNCDGLRVEYGHLKSYADTVAQGVSVTKGQVVGLSGNTAGKQEGTTGKVRAQVHIGLYQKEGAYINPDPILSAWEASAAGLTQERLDARPTPAPSQTASPTPPPIDTPIPTPESTPAPSDTPPPSPDAPEGGQSPIPDTPAA